MARMTFVFLSLAALVALCADAQAQQWKVCNKTPEHLLVAIGYHSPEHPSAIATKGWYQLRSCGCDVVLPYGLTDRDEVYLFGQNNARVGKFESDHPQLCITQG